MQTFVVFPWAPQKPKPSTIEHLETPKGKQLACEKNEQQNHAQRKGKLSLFRSTI